MNKKYTVTARNMKEPAWITVSAPTAERAIEKVENFLGMALDTPLAIEVK